MNSHGSPVTTAHTLRPEHIAMIESHAKDNGMNKSEALRDILDQHIDFVELRNAAQEMSDFLDVKQELPVGDYLVQWTTVIGRLRDGLAKTRQANAARVDGEPGP